MANLSNRIKEIYDTASDEEKQELILKFGESYFKSDIISRVGSYEDACKELGKDTIAELPYPNPTTNRQEFLNAGAMLDIITEALLEGTVLDWSNAKQKKWCPIFYNYKDGSGWSFRGSNRVWSTTDAAGGARLFVDSEEKANHLGKMFLSIWNKFLNPNK